ncbi:MAG TPA: ABC transporter substrate-binding protein [Candidatus Binatia bacterium]|jgi:ABC-type nitrate/sulfonate/bicarbonate transport system substrate-binding protein|nr:ABC transporter substrate-binding protein [Candidatus Binatia bacterium]
MRSTKIVQAIAAAALLSFLQSEPSFAIDNLRVAYPSMNTSVFALVIAQKEGYFKEEGINVELLSIRGEIAIRTTLAGEVDFFTNAGSALAAGVRGVPVRLVTVFQDKPGWDLIAEPEIKSVAQLRGKNIGVMSPEGSLAVVAREMLRKNGLDPSKDVNLVVMGGDEVRFPALQTKSIQATLFNTAMSLRAQKEGFRKLGTASEYANLIEGGLATSHDKIKQAPDKIFRFVRGALKGLNYYVTKREPAIKYMMDGLRIKDRDLVTAIYDIQTRLVLKEGFSEDKVLQSMIEDMKRTTKVQRDIKVGDIFDLSFVKKANEELKANGWKP